MSTCGPNRINSLQRPVIDFLLTLIFIMRKGVQEVQI
jgi:hypothetical protein